MKYLVALALVVGVPITAFLYIHNNATPPKPPAAVAIGSVPQPLRVVIGYDCTKSVDMTRIAPLTAVELAPLLDRLRNTGGEIAIGTITDDSNRPFVRLYVPSPPLPPVPSERQGTVFDQATATKRDEDAKRQFEGALTAWRRDADARISAFLNDVDPILNHPVDAPQTDVRSFLARADLVLAEPSPFKVSPMTAVLLVSDAIETASEGPLPSLRSSATIVIVNGVGTLGSLVAVSPVRYEATAPAVRFIAGEGVARGN